MFFSDKEFSVRLISAHLLSWGYRDVVIPPKKSFALSYRCVGDCRFSYNDKEVSAASGDICYFPKGVGYSIKAGRERLYGINFEVEGEMPRDIFSFSTKSRRSLKRRFQRYTAFGPSTRRAITRVRSPIFTAL